MSEPRHIQLPAWTTLDGSSGLPTRAATPEAGCDSDHAFAERALPDRLYRQCRRAARPAAGRCSSPMAATPSRRASRWRIREWWWPKAARWWEPRAEIAARKPSRLGIEAEHMTVATRSLLARELRGSKLIATSGVVEGLRMLKEPEEVDAIREAVLLGARLLPLVLRALRPGRSEMEVAARLEYAARRAGAEGMSFETIVASGRALGAAARRCLRGAAAEAGIRSPRLRCYTARLLLRHDPHGSFGQAQPAGERLVQCGAGGAACGDFRCQSRREIVGGRSRLRDRC